MTPRELALLHQSAFSNPPPWSESAFASLLADPTVTLLISDDARAFLLGRIVADEAEILTLATHPEARRKGQARALVLRFVDFTRAQSAIAVHLEVAENNAPARALYAACGFVEVGRRPGYYRDATGRSVPALLFRRTVPPL